MCSIDSLHCIYTVREKADFYTKRERSLDEVFPWDFIDTGVTKEFLKREWQNAMEENVTPNCRMRCSGCGAAQFKTGVCMAER